MFDPIYDLEDYYDYHRSKNIRSCRYCGEDNLHWVRTKNGWRLYNEDDIMHVCRIEAKLEETSNCSMCNSHINNKDRGYSRICFSCARKAFRRGSRIRSCSDGTYQIIHQLAPKMADEVESELDLSTGGE